MRFVTAIKAFFAALKDPKKAELLLAPLPAPEREPKAKAERSHLRFLSLLQQSSRLVDFLKEDLSSYDDAQVGAAARKIHEDCGKCLEELVTVRYLMEENEGSKITIPQGYDSEKIKLVGKVKGQPPFSGILVHKGWKAHKLSLPKQVGEQTYEVICPAEIEIR